MRNDKYWATRAAKLMYGFMDDAEAEADSVSKIYERASGWLSIEAEEIFERFRMKHGLSEKEARRLLRKIRDKEDLQELMRKLEAGDYSEMGKQELIRILEAPAYRARLERLQQLQNQISLIMRDVYQQELQRTTQFYTDLANEAYYRSMFEVQQRAGYGFSFNHLDNKTVARILKSKWSGKNYSNRIWKNTAALADTVKEEVLINFITGRTDREAAEVIRNKFASGAMEARRLIRTESAFVSGEVTARAYKEAEIEKYRYVAILDLKTSEICRELDGQEFALKDKKVGTNYPPMHPWCRSTTIAAPTAEELAKMKRRARDPITGKTYLVPASMTYKEWYDKFVKGKPEAEAKETPQEQEVVNEKTDLPMQKERIYQDGLKVDMRKSRMNPENEYEGIPKSWGNPIEISSEEAVRNANPRFEINSYSKTELPYNTNCANCVVAAEMRFRGYPVIARAKNENRKLATDPFSAWKNVEPVTLLFEKIELDDFINRLPDQSRVQIAVKYPKSVFKSRLNHTFIAYKKNNKIYYADPQNGSIIKDVEKEFFDGSSEIRYCRIDNAEISDRGCTACERA